MSQSPGTVKIKLPDSFCVYFQFGMDGERSVEIGGDDFIHLSEVRCSGHIVKTLFIIYGADFHDNVLCPSGISASYLGIESQYGGISVSKMHPNLFRDEMRFFHKFPDVYMYAKI